MLEGLIYIFKLYIGFFLISFALWKVRFWDECYKFDCVFKYLYRALALLFVILFLAVLLKSFDLFFVVSLFVLIYGIDFVLVKRKLAMKVNFLKISLNQKIYDLIDGAKKFALRINLNFKLEHIALMLIFLFGLIIWMNPALQSKSLSSVMQHNNLVKITSILLNNYNFEMHSFAISSICAFFSLAFGINQYMVLHLFGAFNFALLFVGISLLTYKLTNDIFSVALSSSLFAYLFGYLGFISNPVEGSSFLLGLGWLFFVLYFWKDEDLTQKFLSFFVLFLIDLFLGFIISVLIFSSVALESILRGSEKRKFTFISLVILFLFLSAIEIYLRRNPELALKVYALLYNPEPVGVAPMVVNVLMFVLSLVLITTFKIFPFYGIFTLILLIFIVVCEMSILSFIPCEQFYPLVVLISFVWFAVMLKKFFARRKLYHRVLVSCVVLMLILNSFLAGGFKLDARIEPDEFVEVINKIQKESLPFSIAIVSHSGTRATFENWAWFMDWDYFLKSYILIDDKKKIYDNVYVLVPKDKAVGKIHELFMPRIDNLIAVLDSVCLNYKHALAEIYFDGDYVRVYKLRKL